MKKMAIVNREVIQSYIITSARYDFSADEKRVLTHLIEDLQPLLEGKKLRERVEVQTDLWNYLHIKCPLSEFLEDGQNYVRLRDAFFSLNNKAFIYRDEESEQIIRLVEMPKIYKRGFIEFALAPKMVEAFLNFTKGYSKYELAVSLSFSSVYAMRLYELLSGQTRPLKFSIDNLKEMFALSEKYKNNADFIRNVIVPAKRELDEKSPYTFGYKPIKKGRKFESILFTPRHQASKEDLAVAEAELKRQTNLCWDISKDLRNYLVRTCGFSPREIKNNLPMLKEVEAAQGVKLLDKVREIWGRARQADNPKGYLIGTLKKMLPPGSD